MIDLAAITCRWLWFACALAVMPATSGAEPRDAAKIESLKFCAANRDQIEFTDNTLWEMTMTLGGVVTGHSLLSVEGDEGETLNYHSIYVIAGRMDDNRLFFIYDGRVFVPC